ncbi:50S ribosomal protein L18 [Candidatus Wolfebacteria bacterium]|nr:MAG: 50S ribosomal protein L18 [Candidatus Wolfebacteria bacterium]
MNTKNSKTEKRLRIKGKIRSQVSGTADRPRFTVFRSNKFIYAQLVDDIKGTTLVSASDRSIKKGTKIERAKQVGAVIAKEAEKKQISLVVFDRNGFKFIGRVKSLADEARTGGLAF